MEEQLPTEGRTGSAMPEATGPQGSWRNSSFLILLGIFVLAWVVWAWVGARHLIPNVFPDEIFYGKMSQSLAGGDGLQWRGTSAGLPPLWPALLSLGWHAGSTVEAWKALKIGCAGLAASTAFPVWFLARTLVGDRRALFAAAFAVVGAWMAVTPFLLSENLTYPLATAALMCLVFALRTVRIRWLLIGLAFAALACLTRTQMLVLPVIFVLALLLDILVQPPGRRWDRFYAWPSALWIVLGGGVVALLLAFIVKPGLTNYDVLETHASIGDVFSTAARHAAVETVAVAFIPVMALFALMLDRDNWRDSTVGPVLITTTAATVALLAIVARFESWATGGHPVERYSMYLAPLLALALVLAPGRITRGRAAVGAALVVIVLLVMPLDYNPVEEPGLYGILHRLDALGGFFSDHLKLGVIIVAALVVTAAVFALSARRPTRGLAVAFGLVALVMLAQSYTFHHGLVDDERVARPLIAPPTLNWVDRAADGPVAIFAVNKEEPFHRNPDLYTDFFNRKVIGLYSNESVSAQECLVKLGASGAFTHGGGGSCPAWPRNLVIVDAGTRVTLRGQQVLARTPHNGRLVRIPAGGPKLLAAVRPPCTGSDCTGALQMGLHLPAQTDVAVTFHGGQADQRIQTPNGIRSVPAGRNTTIQTTVAAGDQNVALPVDWNTPDGPTLRSVVLNSAGQTTRIY